VLVPDVHVDELAGEIEVGVAPVVPHAGARGADDHRWVERPLGRPRVEHVGAVVGVRLGQVSIGQASIGHVSIGGGAVGIGGGCGGWQVDAGHATIVRQALAGDDGRLLRRRAQP
jgi:hypothetical protein